MRIRPSLRTPLRLLLAAGGAVALSGCGAMLLLDGVGVLATTGMSAAAELAMGNPLLTARAVKTGLALQRRADMESATPEEAGDKMAVFTPTSSHVPLSPSRLQVGNHPSHRADEGPQP